MPDLPPRPDLDQLRRQAKDLLRAAQCGDRPAVARIAAVSDRSVLASAQLTVAREYGFPSWARLKAEIARRAILDERNLDRLTALLAARPEAAVEELRWCDHPGGAAPLNYVAMLRYDTARNMWRDVPGTGAMARALLRAGAPVDGRPDDPENPLMTAASYGDAEVTRVLVEAGASLEATAAPNAAGVPGGTARRHAAVFGMTDVVDVLVAAGARVDDITVAAAAGDVTGWLCEDTPDQDRVRALVMAADHERLEVIDRLVAAGTPIDAVDETWGRQAIWTAAANGRPAGVRRLLAHGADPNLRDTEHRTALHRCRASRPNHLDSTGQRTHPTPSLIALVGPHGWCRGALVSRTAAVRPTRVLQSGRLNGGLTGRVWR
jgi:ankyrin repeat protein